MTDENTTKVYLENDLGRSIDGVRCDNVAVKHIAPRVDEIAGRYAQKITIVGNEILRILPECCKRGIIYSGGVRGMNTGYTLYSESSYAPPIWVGEISDGCKKADIKFEKGFKQDEVFSRLQGFKPKILDKNNFDVNSNRYNTATGIAINCSVPLNQFRNVPDTILKFAQLYFGEDKRELFLSGERENGFAVESSISLGVNHYELKLGLNGIAARGEFYHSMIVALSVHGQTYDVPREFLGGPITTLADMLSGSGPRNYEVVSEDGETNRTRVIYDRLVLDEKTAKAIVGFDLSLAGNYLPLAMLPLIHLTSARNMLVSALNARADKSFDRADSLEKKLGEI